MNSSCIIMGSNANRRTIELDEVNSYDQPKLRDFIVELKALLASLDENIAALKKYATAHPEDGWVATRLFRAKHKQRQVMYFLGKAKVRHREFETARKRPRQKIILSVQDHDEHQRIESKFTYFRRAALIEFARQIIGDDEFNLLAEKARLKAISELTEWAKTANVSTAIFEHVIANRGA